jgi:ubiquinone/menaquinone biosynthesis C-methylase UbiE/uncharacterized protein YbaR (Trm112 family)
MNENRFYVCPACKGDLAFLADGLRCETCQTTYPLVDGIPDFMPADVRGDANPVVRNVDRVDRIAHVYESAWWYPLVLTIYAGWRKTSLPEIVRVVGEMIHTDGRLILDAACGPATLGRRIVSPAQALYGTDISLGMLRAGQTYAQRERLTNVHFARARVEALPFRPLAFDAAICGGSLHLFPDTVAALREIGRTLKPGAPLAVTTFVAGNGGILRFRRIREHVRSEHRLHVFELPELEDCLAQAGFEGFSPRLFGSFVVFRAVRCNANPGDAA